MSDSNKRLKELFLFIERTDPDNDLFRQIKERHEVSDIDKLIEEICEDGSNTLSWPLFGAVPYSEVAYDAARMCKVEKDTLKEAAQQNPDAPEEAYETLLLKKVIEEKLNKMSEEERKELESTIAKQVGNNNANLAMKALLGIGGPVGNAFLMKVAQQAIKQVIIAIAGRQGAGLIAYRTAGFLVPGLNAIMALWLAIDIAGPAYRKTVPTVFAIALLRLDMKRQSISEDW